MYIIMPQPMPSKNTCNGLCAALPAMSADTSTVYTHRAANPASAAPSRLHNSMAA